VNFPAPVAIPSGSKLYVYPPMQAEESGPMFEPVE
jgi:hypothetical protein